MTDVLQTAAAAVSETGTPEPIKNRYLGLRVMLLWQLLKSGKLSIRKIWNAGLCYVSYFLRRPNSAKTPIVINFELWNECNESCVFCRSGENSIYDTNPKGDGTPIPKGKMLFNNYKSVISATADSLMLSIPYINGEPLMSKDIYEAIQYATDRKVGTLIASNGILLNERNSRKLLESGLDCLKVHISGFTSAVHSIEHRRGDVERIKQNLLDFMKIKAELKSNTIVVLDYILYEHNKHELEDARRFARDNGLVFNIRPGNPAFMEETEHPQLAGKLPTDLACDWLWTVLSIDWNGAVYPCCDHVTWSGADSYGAVGSIDFLKTWNGPLAQRMRMIHSKQGRTPIPICSQCPRQGLRFKW